MKAHELVRSVINKKIVPKQEGRGRRGYGNLRRIRLLVYQMVKGTRKDKNLIKHLEKNPEVRHALGFHQKIPNRSRLSRWKENYSGLLNKVFQEVRKLVAGDRSKLLVVDSTPLEDYEDPDAKFGFYSRGPFKGFKVHLSVNQDGLPMKARITPGNRHDSQFFKDLLIKAEKVLGDAGYDSEKNRELCRNQESEPLIARNSRNTNKKFDTPELLKKERYLVEQFNSILKETLQECWKLVKGIKRKASVVYSTLTAILLSSIAQGSRKLSSYWC